jgi:cytochrome c oxidase cbb3-type subunit 3
MLEGHKHGTDRRDFDGIIDDRGQGIPKGYVLLFYGLVIWGVLFIGFYLFSGWSSHGEFEDRMEAHRAATTAQAPAATPVAPVRSETEVLAAGKELYAKHCRSCHGAEGKGGVGSDLTAPDYEHGRSLDAVRKSIAGGRPGGMPQFGNRLSGDDVEAIARFVLSLK